MSINWDTVEKALQDFVVTCSGLADTNVIYDDGKPRPSGTYISMVINGERNPANDEQAYGHNPLVLADDLIEAVNIGPNTATLTAHAYVNVDGPVQITTSGSLVGSGLAVLTDYWLIVVDANTVKFAASRALAIAGTAIDLLAIGTGAHTIVDTPNTRRKGAEVKYISRGPRRYELQIQCFSTAPKGVNSSRAILSKLVSRSTLPSITTALDAAGIGVVGFEPVDVVGAVGNFTVFEPRAVTTLVFNLASEESETGTNIVTAQATRHVTGQPTKTVTINV